MFFPGSDTFTDVPSSQMPVGNYMLGLSHGVVILHNMQLGEQIEASRSQIINRAILTFEPYWSRPVSKHYLFKGLCPSTAARALALIAIDTALVSRLWTPEWVEYGFVDTDNTRAVNMNNGTVDLDMAFIAVYEKSLRTP